MGVKTDPLDQQSDMHSNGDISGLGVGGYREWRVGGGSGGSVLIGALEVSREIGPGGPAF